MKFKGGPLRLVATAGVMILGGIYTVSLVSSLAVKAIESVIENKRKKTAPPCGVCKGLGFVQCKLCKGKSVIDWSPLYDPVVLKPCVCPTCEGNRVQRCLNCIGKGYT
ncbi:hypothetical protein O6H91_14G019400 [Diphasiastrum complanatum]|uniref:Uncharacterized protein n=1 Tax=Diphasiastrum complanatum TaxID=34168 RepID=A0ACC2BM28_DIPCM|nr:hypothetical protein O6H91_14G019400 [Diphasiastrum complanatum]